MEKCLFCENEPNSNEHVFLAALGGRLVSRHATCRECNGYFASSEGGKIDDGFAEQFIAIRCGLAIWSGRNKPPPTIQRAGAFQDGVEFDFAPGFIPALRAPSIPKNLETGVEQQFWARDITEARKVIQISNKRGFNLEIKNVKRVQRKAPETYIEVNLGGSAGLRSAAKAAVTGACVFYGNEQARTKIDSSVLQAIYKNDPDISTLAGWDFTNEWPTPTSISAHPKTPDAQLSGFEHSLVIGDVADDWVAYVKFFGGFCFSVHLGSRSGLPAKGLAVNPRAMKSERFDLAVSMPEYYKCRNQDSTRTEFGDVSNRFQSALENIMERWRAEDQQKHYEQQADDLNKQLMSVGDDDTKRNAVIRRWAEKIITLEFGESWYETLDVADLDDSGSVE